MLKITLEPDVDETRLKLEGDLAGPWVTELEEYWRKTSPSLSGQPVCIDLTGVGRVDDAGRYLLALIHDSGARMVSAGVEMKELLDSITRDWPPRRMERPGRVASPAIRVRRR